MSQPQPRKLPGKMVVLLLAGMIVIGGGWLVFASLAAIRKAKSHSDKLPARELQTRDQPNRVVAFAFAPWAVLV